MVFTLFFRLKGTVIVRIWWQVFLAIIYTTGVLGGLKYFENDWKTHFPESMSIPVLGVSTALLLAFRTNTAYDRYWEGRNLWSKLSLNIRNLTRLFWVRVEEKEGSGKEVIEKLFAINLLVAFAYATKNYLREEYSYDDKELQELLSHIPTFGMPDNDERQRVDSFKQSRSRVLSRTRSTKAFEKTVPTNIPIEISHQISSYIDSVWRRGLVDSSTTNAMNNSLSNLVECLGGFERILRTPIPLAYSVHLHQATWLYILSLPFQLFGSLGWLTIPAVTIAAFALLGILAIGREIENPFGYDPNDLPMDDFCKVVREEAHNVVNHVVPMPDTWIYSHRNNILSNYSAVDLMKMSAKDVKSILTRGNSLTYM